MRISPRNRAQDSNVLQFKPGPDRNRGYVHSVSPRCRPSSIWCRLYRGIGADRVKYFVDPRKQHPQSEIRTIRKMPSRLVLRSALRQDLTRLRLRPHSLTASFRAYPRSIGGQEAARRTAGQPDLHCRGRPDGRRVQIADADRFAANLLPIIRSIQSAGPIGMSVIAKRLKSGAYGWRVPGSGMYRPSQICWLVRTIARRGDMKRL